MGEEKRHQMMQNLFGDQSEEEEEEDEIDSEQEVGLRRPTYQSDEEGEGEAELEGEGEAEVEVQGEEEVESEAEIPDVGLDQVESEGERVQSSPDRDLSDQRLESQGKEAESEDEEDYGQRVVTSGRREIASGSEKSDENHFIKNGDEEVDQARRPRRHGVIASGSEESDEHHSVENEDEEVDQAKSPRSPSEQNVRADISHSAAEIRDVFGDSDEDEPADYAPQNNLEDDIHRSPIEEEEGIYEKNLRPEDIIADEDGQYESDEENFEQKLKEKPIGPPLELEIPLRQPPGLPDKMNMIKVSNIMGIEPKPFDPKTYVEEDVFVTDESGAKKRLRLEDNIVRWRSVQNRDGSMSYESNARFVRWSDGSLQLLIGNEVLDLSVQDAQHDQTHLFLRHGKGILQSQGRLLHKMRFMPSSLSSKSHRLLTALVDSRHKKIYKVKNCVTDIDPEREKEEKEKAVEQKIKTHENLLRKQEKVTRKYTQVREKEPQLSPGYLEEALEEDEAEDYPTSRRETARRFEEELEAEGWAERRILNAKKSHVPKEVLRKPSLGSARSSKRPMELSESEREESEYETDEEEEERPASRKKMEEREEEEEDEEDYQEEEAVNEELEEDEAEEEPRERNRESGKARKREEFDSEEDSPPRKMAVPLRRRAVIESDED